MLAVSADVLQPNCTEDGGWTHGYTPFKDCCPSGWVNVNGSEVAPPPNPSLVWLFDVLADPLEHNNVADENPDVVRVMCCCLAWVTS